MIGIIDIGGGMRGIYTSGLFDYLMDKGISFRYYLGVSSGSANLIAYAAGQRGRTYNFYTKDAFDKSFMGIGSYLRSGMIMNLDKIFENPLKTENGTIDFLDFMTADFSFTAVSTHMKTLEPRYFTKADFTPKDFSALKAAAAMPVACRNPVKFRGDFYFDGGLSDPSPIRRHLMTAAIRLSSASQSPSTREKQFFRGTQ